MIFVVQSPANERGEWVIVMSYCAVGNALAVTREHDYNQKGDCHYYGVAMHKEYDTHYAQLDPASGTGYKCYFLSL